MPSHPVVPAPGSLTVYATSWCPYCAILLGDLRRDRVPHTVVDVDTAPDADAASAFVESVNGGNRVVPTVVFPDGTTATNPSLGEVMPRLAR